MIKLLLSGGLGNQMFQYAFARALALRAKTGLKISRRFLRNDGFGRSYSLHHLSLPEEFLMTEREERAAHALMYVSRKLGLKNGCIYDKRFDAVRADCFGRDNLTLQGYFQSARNFAGYEEVIRRELKVSTPPSRENAEMIHELAGCESVCVDVRRGDYLTLKFGSVCGYEYYASAMKYVADRVKSPVFYMFSNTHEDIAYLRENWEFPGLTVKYVDLSNPDYEELRLMYSCQHFIIANSSLSWWGSYLCENPRKIVCAPSRWIDDRPTAETNIFLPGWTITDKE